MSPRILTAQELLAAIEEPPPTVDEARRAAELARVRGALRAVAGLDDATIVWVRLREARRHAQLALNALHRANP